MFDLHDARLLAVIASDERRFILRFKTDNDKICELIFHDVQRLRCDNFREGNIVFSISLSSGVLVSQDKLRWALGVSAGDEAAYIQQLRTKIHHGEFSLVELIPSYGAQLMAIVKNAELHPLE